MNDFTLILVSLSLKMALAGGALYAVLWLLTWMNDRAGFSFDRWIGTGDDIESRNNPGHGIYLGLRFLGLCILLASILGCPAQAVTIPDRYDREIKTAADTWMPGVPWTIYKSQLYQESLLKPDAVSHVGARGLAQFMPATWREVAGQLGYGADVSPHMVEPAILAGAYYMHRQRSAWRAVGDFDRHRLACGSYNAGLGNIRKAWRRAGSSDWPSVAAALPAVTGRHALETQTYVTRIWRWFAVLSV